MKSRKKKKTIEERAAFRKDIPETSDSEMSRRALVDRVPGKPTVVTHQEWLHDRRVGKGIFFGKISSGDDYSFTIQKNKEIWDYEMKESIIGGSEDEMVSLSEILEEEELILIEKLRKNLILLKVENLKFYFDESGPNFSFNFPKQTDFDFMIGSIIQVDETNNLVFNGIVSKRQSYTISLKQDETNVKDIHIFESNTSADWNFFKEVLMLDDDFSAIYKSMKYLRIEKKSIEFSFTQPKDLNIILELVKGFYEELLYL